MKNQIEILNEQNESFREEINYFEGINVQI